MSPGNGLALLLTTAQIILSPLNLGVTVSQFLMDAHCHIWIFMGLTVKPPHSKIATKVTCEIEVRKS